MDILIAVALGVVGGVVGVIPFFFARRRIKARLKRDGVGSIATGMAATLVSFAVMVVEMVFCYLLAADYLLPFAISAIVVFLLAMGGYTALLMRR
jgi:hypothetical protein